MMTLYKDGKRIGRARAGPTRDNPLEFLPRGRNPRRRENWVGRFAFERAIGCSVSEIERADFDLPATARHSVRKAPGGAQEAQG